MGSVLVLLLFVALAVGCNVYWPLNRTCWRDLEEHYRDTTEGVPIREESFWYQSCRVDGMRTQLLVEIRRGGLFLQMGWAANLAAAPVLIPWDKLTLVHVTEGSLLTRAHIELEVAHYPLQILIPGRAGEAVAAYIKQVQGLTGPGPNYFFKPAA